MVYRPTWRKHDGIHAASDTYRHSKANGNNTGSWDWYAETLGGSVQNNPNHTSANHLAEMTEVNSHPVTENITFPWEKQEKYYYWENGYLNNDITALFNVESTGAESFDAERPMGWVQTTANGELKFVSAATNAGTDESFIFTEIVGQAGFARTADFGKITEGQADSSILDLSISMVYPNPARDLITVNSTLVDFKSKATFEVYSETGDIVNAGEFANQQIDISDLQSGLYIIVIKTDKEQETLKFMKE